MTTYIELGGGGGASSGLTYWGDPVADFASLPPTGTIGEIRITYNNGEAYYWDGAQWTGASGIISPSDVTTTDSIAHTSISGVLNSDVRLSADAATASFLKATTTIKTGVNPGLHVEIPYADTDTIGVLTDTDWDTFNDKEPAITATTAADYYRGDKTFQTLEIPALQAVDGTTGAAPGDIGETTNTAVTSPSSTGVGATGTWGSVLSLSVGAGEWVVYGRAGFSENGANLSKSLSCVISESATGVGVNEYECHKYPFLVSSTDDLVVPAPYRVFRFSSTTTIYLNTRFYYDAGSPQHFGYIQARRIR